MCFMCFYVFLLCVSWMNIVWPGAWWFGTIAIHLRYHPSQILGYGPWAKFNCSSLCNGSSVGGMARLRLWPCLSVLLPSSSDFSPSSFTLPNDSRRPPWFAFLDYSMHNLGSSGCHRAQNGSKASKRAISNCFKLARQFVLNGYI
jgi:hypothetical protein